MDNIYNSAAISRQHKIMRKLLTRGVTRKGIRGIPPCITQEVLESKKSQIETRGTSEEAFMEGDPKCNNLVEAVMYDTKPLHCISMVPEELKWVFKEIELFNVQMSKVKN